MAALQLIYMAALQWEVGQKAIIAMTLRNDAPQYFG